jgi:hypothetical protein
MRTVPFDKVKYRRRLLRITLILLAVTTLAFLPWQAILSIEVRSTGLGKITSCLGWGCLFLLLCSALVLIIQYETWISGLMLLVLPIVIFVEGMLTLLIAIIPPGKWHDQAVYHNGNNYLIMQDNEIGDKADRIEYRL